MYYINNEFEKFNLNSILFWQEKKQVSSHKATSLPESTSNMTPVNWLAWHCYDNKTNLISSSA